MPFSKWYENEYFLHFLLTIHPQGCVAIFLLHFEFPGLRMRISLLRKLPLLWSYAETAVDSAIDRQRWGESGGPPLSYWVSAERCTSVHGIGRAAAEEGGGAGEVGSSLLMHPSF